MSFSDWKFVVKHFNIKTAMKMHLRGLDASDILSGNCSAKRIAMDMVKWAGNNGEAHAPYPG